MTDDLFQEKADCLLVNGHVIDPWSGVNEKRDIHIKNGVVAQIGKGLKIHPPPSRIINLAGSYVTPGLVDFHTHIYPQGTPFCVDHETLIERDGTVCFIDAGTTGSHTFRGFHDLVVKKSKVHIYCFLHICCNGLSALPTKEVGELLDIRLLDAPGAQKLIKEFPAVILGVKIRLDKWAIGDKWQEGLTAAVKLARDNELPLVAHIANSGPTVADLIDYLQEGDVIAHFCRKGPKSPIDANNEVHDYCKAARDKGILLDIAHGNGGFSFAPAEQIIKQGFYPDIISSDISAGCLNEKTLGLCNTMSKLYGLGMPLTKVVSAATTTPAKFTKNKELGRISVGDPVNLTFLEIKQGDYQLQDRDSTQTFKEIIAARGCLAKGKLLHFK